MGVTRRHKEWEATRYGTRLELGRRPEMAARWEPGGWASWEAEFLMVVWMREQRVSGASGQRRAADLF